MVWNGPAATSGDLTSNLVICPRVIQSQGLARSGSHLISALIAKRLYARIGLVSQKEMELSICLKFSIFYGNRDKRDFFTILSFSQLKVGLNTNSS